MPRHLPVSMQECRQRNWDSVDIVLVTGDAYIDHPSFGIALIGRLLEKQGYRVAILPQPRYDQPDDFLRFGIPRLFYGITAGNLDSLVANYSGNGTVRQQDAYSPGGNPWRSKEQHKNNRFRPDRATLFYTNLAKAAGKGIPVILGGVEASLRRFVHYDYKQQRLRSSILSDSKADLLVYGMGELAIVEAAARIAAGKPLTGIKGTCMRLTDREAKETIFSATREKLLSLPSWQEINNDNKQFLTAEKQIDAQARSYSDKLLVQKQQAVWIVQNPPSPPLSTQEMDDLYSLKFTRQPHPSTPDVPAHRMIRHSVTIVRGCSGNCSFCAISRHQGPAISSRSNKSIINEIKEISRLPDFTGTITDLGGPTANLFATSCKIGSCKKHDCLYPEVCKNLEIDENRFVSLLDQASSLSNIKHLYISSGLRMELLLKTPRLLQKILKNHTPGTMKIAPEHTETEILDLMHKESHKKLENFLQTCRKYSAERGKKFHCTPYIITAHPGCTEQHTRAMAKKLQKLGLKVRQFQDFTPTPGTISTAMYVTGLHRDSLKKIFVPRNKKERMAQRHILQKLMPPR